jgi:hypothetical protein
MLKAYRLGSKTKLKRNLSTRNWLGNDMQKQTWLLWTGTHGILSVSSEKAVLLANWVHIGSQVFSLWGLRNVIMKYVCCFLNTNVHSKTFKNIFLKHLQWEYTTALQCIKTLKLYTLAGFEPRMFCSGGGRDDQYICLAVRSHSNT